MTDLALPDVDWDVLEEAQPDLWAMWIGDVAHLTVVPEGCPRTGWLHEGGEPWRVIVAEDPFKLPCPSGCDRRPYTGDEPTVHVNAWLAGR